MSSDNRHQQIFRNNHRDDSSSGSDHFRQKEDHETHSLALFFLVLTVIVVVGVAFFYGQDDGVTPFADWDSETATSSDSAAAETAGPTIPAESPSVEEVSEISVGLPGNFPEDIVAEITRNQRLSAGESGTQRLVEFRSTSSPDEIYSSLENWISQAGDWEFTSPEERENIQSFTAETGTSQMIVVVSSADDLQSSVQINYLNN